MTLAHINPQSLPRNPAFSQGVLIEGPGDLLVIGGQNGVDATDTIVGDDIGSQTVQALRNVLAVLESVGATRADVAKLTVYLVAPADVPAVYAGAQEVWGEQPTALTVLQVAALARPDCLVELDALAHVRRK